MPVILLAALTELGSMLGTLSAGAEAVFSFVGSRWWLAALADVAVKHLTGGKHGFPRSMDQAMTTAGQLALAEAQAALTSQAMAPILRAVAEAWETRMIMDLAEREGGIKLNLDNAIDFIAKDIPDGMTLPEWINQVCVATGLTREQILALRANFSH